MVAVPLRRSICIVAVLVLSLLACSSTTRAQEVISSNREANVKAVFLYSFGRYVTWPESELGTVEDEFVIGVFGESEVTGKLQHVATTRKIAGRAIQVIPVESVDQIPQCHILFVAGYADEGQQQAIIEATAGRPLLLVGESHGFAERGAAINFYISEGKVRFHINAETIRQRKLQPNAQLLNLGDRVGGPPRNQLAPGGQQF